jgi:hypothetical protein
MLLISIIGSYAATFDWNPTPYKFYLTQNTSWQYDINVTCSESSVNFSMEEKPFTNLSLNKNSGLMTFTPTNGDVTNYPGLRTGPYLLIVRNVTDPDDYITTNIYFNITNINDYPEMNSYSPSTSSVNIAENNNQVFNVLVTDPDTPYGDTLSYSWYLNGSLQSSSSSWSFTPNYCQSGDYYLNVSIKDTSDATINRSWSVTVTNIDRAPQFNSSNNISNITWNEDLNLINNISLSNHFYDLDYWECTGNNKDSLTFSYNITDANITVVISSDNVSFYPIAHWQGNASIVFRVSDGTTFNQSNTVFLYVNSLPDAPILYLQNVSWVPNLPYYRQINATDPDIPYGDSLNFSYSAPSLPEFNMNLSGYINFTPTTYGNHSINITVIDSFGLNDTKTLLFRVRSNNSPVLFSISNQQVNETFLFSINISGFDVDDDTFNISSNFTFFNYTRLNTTTVNFFFTPNQSHVGNHSILFRINDSFGGYNTTVMSLEVLNINSEPTLNPIGNQISKINRTFTLVINASDMDGDYMNFYDNASFFNITLLDPLAGIALINFTYSGVAANYSVIINVSDNVSSDYEIINFELTYNRNPILYPIDIQNGTTGIPLELNILFMDPDGDAVTFSSNHSRINFIQINTTLAMLYFTPIVNETGINNISITATDSDGANGTISFLLNVSYLNHQPYFGYLSNVTCNINVSCRFNVTGNDVDGTLLNFSLIPNIFNKTVAYASINSTIMEYNFTPWNSSISTYKVNVTIQDENLSRSVNITLFINRHPIINWTSPYTNESQVINEGVSIAFNITAYDPDGSMLNYTWLMNQTTKANTSNWTYYANYASSGFYNITVFVSDGFFNVSSSWNLTITNYNRAPDFGLITKTTESDFTGGTLDKVNITVQSGDIALAWNETGYYGNGLYVSGVITIPKEYWANVSLLSISWNATLPNSTSILVYSRGSSDNSVWGNWSDACTDASGSPISDLDKKYLQYMINFSTNNTNITPVLEEVKVRYIIPNFTAVTSNYYWLDLDTYFSDPDGQLLNYTATPVENVDFLIWSDGQVELRPYPASWYGTRTIQFNASDGENITQSNVVTLTFTPPVSVAVPTPIIVPISGGGGGSSMKTVVMMMNITEQIYIELVVPGPLKMMPNQTISAPITLRNKGTKPLTSISLKGTINSSDSNVSITFKDEFFNELLPSEQKTTDMIIKSSKFSGSYFIKVLAEVKVPNAVDSAIIHLEILDNYTNEVNSVRDLLRQYPECLELNEVMEKAYDALRNNDYTRASLLLDSAIDGCKYLISSSGKVLELQKATRVSQIDTKIVAGAVFTIVMLLLIIYYLAVTRHVQKV